MQYKPDRLVQQILSNDTSKSVARYKGLIKSAGDIIKFLGDSKPFAKAHPNLVADLSYFKKLLRGNLNFNIKKLDIKK